MSKLYMIKPLEWNDYDHASYAQSLLGTWGAVNLGKSDSWMTTGPNGDLCGKPTREEAKAAAWDTYDAKMAEGMEEVDIESLEVVKELRRMLLELLDCEEANQWGMDGEYELHLLAGRIRGELEKMAGELT